MVKQKCKISKEAQDNNIKGRALVKFIIYSDGHVGKAVMAREGEVDKLLEDEAIRAVMSMPNWIPGKINGEPVNSYFYLPINFK